MSTSPSLVQQGYLLLADISGYTSFLTQTELDHSHEILTDLLETVLKRFKSLLTIHKIEGDAIFAYSPQDAHRARRDPARTHRSHLHRFPRAHEERPPPHHLHLPRLPVHPHARSEIHGPPRRFRRCRTSAARASWPAADVNLVHRLLKNHVAENTGWRAYALFTQAALDSMRVRARRPGGVRRILRASRRNHCRSHDGPACPLRRAAAGTPCRCRKGRGPAHVFAEELNGPPPYVWSWMNEPEKRKLYSMDPHGLNSFRSSARAEEQASAPPRTVFTGKISPCARPFWTGSLSNTLPSNRTAARWASFA